MKKQASSLQEKVKEKDSEGTNEVAEENSKEPTFLDHLEDLRWHIIRSFIVALVFVVLAFIFSNFIWKYIILAPKDQDFITFQTFCQLSEWLNVQIFCIEKPLPFILQSRKVFGQFTMDLLVAITVGVIVAFPYIVWEFWKFLKPGLYDNEKKVTKGAVFWVSLLFFIGIGFGYYLIAPLSLHFLSNYQVMPGVIENQFDIVSYVSFLSTLSIACGLMFQLPVVCVFLAKSGLITASFLRYYRRHSIIIILFISAIITPPDVVSQILISLPLLILYQVSIFLVKKEEKKIEKELIEF